MVLSTILAVEGSRSVRPHWGPRPPGGIGGFSGPLGPRTASAAAAAQASTSASNGGNVVVNSSNGRATAAAGSRAAAPTVHVGGSSATALAAGSSASTSISALGNASSVAGSAAARRFDPALAATAAEFMAAASCATRNGIRPSHRPSSVPWRRGPDGQRECKKYAWLCGACGATMVALGIMYFVVYFVIRNQTSSMQYFETIPTYVPACLLTVTGLLIACFMRKTNRTPVMTKLAGVSCMTCAVVCVVVTITTTVVHMNRLQTLRECVYMSQVRACACFSAVAVDPGGSGAGSGTSAGSAAGAGGGNGPLGEGGKFVFGATESCDVVHGFLYTCLRIVFGVSVVAIILCIFSCMLTYQLVSHEKKKVYWEQLELRRQSFLRNHPSFLYCGCHDEYGFPTADPYGWCSCSNAARLLESTSDVRTLTSPAELGLGPTVATSAPRTWRGASHQAPRRGLQRDDLQEGNVSNGWRFLPWKRKRQQQSGTGPEGTRNGCPGDVPAAGWQHSNDVSTLRNSHSDAGTESLTAAGSMQMTEESSFGGPSVGNSARSLRYSFLSNSSFDPGPRSRRGIVGSASFHVPPGLAVPGGGAARGHHMLHPGIMAHDPLCHQYPFLPSYHHHHHGPPPAANWGPPPPYSNPDSLGSGQSESASETSPALGPPRHRSGTSAEDSSGTQRQAGVSNNRRGKDRVADSSGQARKPRPTSYPASAAVRGLVYNNLPQPAPVHAKRTRRTVLTSAAGGGDSQQGVRKYYGIDLDAARRSSHHRENRHNANNSLQSIGVSLTPNRVPSAESRTHPAFDPNRSDTLPRGFSFSTAQLALKPPERLTAEDYRLGGDGTSSPTLTATDAEVASFFADLPDEDQGNSLPKLNKSWPNVNLIDGLSIPKSEHSADNIPDHEFGLTAADANKPKAQRSLSLKTMPNGCQKLGVWKATSRLGVGSLPNRVAKTSHHAYCNKNHKNQSAVSEKQPFVNHHAILSCDNLPLVVPAHLSPQKEMSTSFSHPAIPVAVSSPRARNNVNSHSFQFRSIHV